MIRDRPRCPQRLPSRGHAIWNSAALGAGAAAASSVGSTPPNNRAMTIAVPCADSFNRPVAADVALVLLRRACREACAASIVRSSSSAPSISLRTVTVPLTSSLTASPLVEASEVAPFDASFGAAAQFVATLSPRTGERRGVADPALGGAFAMALEIDAQLALVFAHDARVRCRQVLVLQAEHGDQRRRVAARRALLGPLLRVDELLRGLDVLRRNDGALLGFGEGRTDRVALRRCGRDREVLGVDDGNRQLAGAEDGGLRLSLAHLERVLREGGSGHHHERGQG